MNVGLRAKGHSLAESTHGRHKNSKTHGSPGKASPFSWQPDAHPCPIRLSPDSICAVRSDKTLFLVRVILYVPGNIPLGEEQKSIILVYQPCSITCNAGNANHEITTSAWRCPIRPMHYFGMRRETIILEERSSLTSQTTLESLLSTCTERVVLGCAGERIAASSLSERELSSVLPAVQCGSRSVTC